VLSARCGNSILFFYYQIKSDIVWKSRGWKNLAEMRQQCLVLFFDHQIKKRHGFEEQGVPPLLEECDVVLEGRPFDSNISAETFYYKVGWSAFIVSE
jgi:hypothetical protein